jgi:hypothetical protein
MSLRLLRNLDVNGVRVRVMVFNATIKNISVISWWSVLLMGGHRGTRRKPPTCRKSLLAIVFFLHFIYSYDYPVHSTSNVVSSNPTQARCACMYSKQQYVIKINFTRWADGFSVLRKLFCNIHVFNALVVCTCSTI